MEIHELCRKTVFQLQQFFSIFSRFFLNFLAGPTPTPVVRDRLGYMEAAEKAGVVLIWQRILGVVGGINLIW